MRRIGYGIVVASLVGTGLCPTRERAGLRGSGASPGYVLFSPLRSGITYLIDTSGRVIHTWQSGFAPGASVHLLGNGHLLRPARDPRLPFFTGGGQGGRIQEFTWNGELVWDFVAGSRERMPHHDVAPLPNGNVLAIVWERRTLEEAIRAGRRPERVTDEALERLRSLGYVVRGAPAPDLRADFLHSNSIAYDSSLDQIALSLFGFNELWVIDHGTTTAEAASHSEGRGGRGSEKDQQLHGQHDVRWIPAGSPGAGNLTIFDNGAGCRGGSYSAVVEISPPLARDGTYSLPPGAAFGPARPVWRYTASNRRSFFADFLSGAHRLPNGNTFICSGPTGRFFEVTPQGDTVWEYHNPFSGDAPNPAGDPPHSVFRATHVPPDHPALAGRDLTLMTTSSPGIADAR